MPRIAFMVPVLTGLALGIPASAQDLGTIIQQVAPALLGQPTAPQPQIHPRDDLNRNGVPDWEERRHDRRADREERRALREEERRLAERERRLEERRRQLEAERRSLERRW